MRESEPRTVPAPVTPRRHVARVTLEVPFHDVDAMKVVWHGHYLKYLEIARTQLLRDLGLGREVSEKLPYTWVVIESKIRHSSPLRFGDRFEVRARLMDVEHRIHIAYEVENLSTGRRAAKAHTMLATLDVNQELLLETPSDLLDHLIEAPVRKVDSSDPSGGVP